MAATNILNVDRIALICQSQSQPTTKTTATATGMSENKRFNELSNGFALVCIACVSHRIGVAFVALLIQETKMGSLRSLVGICTKV